jgi:hypothetical protein
MDSSITQSLTAQLWKGNSLTEKQGALSLKIIKKYHKALSIATGIDILQFVSNPVYKYPFRQTQTVKKISMFSRVSDSIVGKIIKVEFPFNESYIDYIKKNKHNTDTAFWSKDERAWLFNLSEKNVNFLKKFMAEENFECDEEFLKASQQQDLIVNNIDKNLPMLCLENGVPYYKNATQYLPALSATEILPAIFEARTHGIKAWDDNIQNFIDSLENTVLKNFLNSELGVVTQVDNKSNPIHSLKEIVLNLRPCIFVIPGGKEIEYLKSTYEFLSSIGIDKKNISVLFRMSNNSGKQFNDFVKNQELNNPLNENTEIVFIDGKVPKTLLKSKIYFNSVINLGYTNAHYSCRFLINAHQNLIYFTESSINIRQHWWMELAEV